MHCYVPYLNLNYSEGLCTVPNLSSYSNEAERSMMLMRGRVSLFEPSGVVKIEILVDFVSPS